MSPLHRRSPELDLDHLKAEVMDDLTEMLTADGECGVRLVVPGAGAIG